MCFNQQCPATPRAYRERPQYNVRPSHPETRVSRFLPPSPCSFSFSHLNKISLRPRPPYCSHFTLCSLLDVRNQQFLAPVGHELSTAESPPIIPALPLSTMSRTKALSQYFSLSPHTHAAFPHSVVEILGSSIFATLEFNSESQLIVKERRGWGHGGGMGWCGPF